MKWAVYFSCLLFFASCGNKKIDNSESFTQVYCSVDFSQVHEVNEAGLADLEAKAAAGEVAIESQTELPNGNYQVELCTDVGNRTDGRVMSPIVTPSISAEVA